MDACLFLLQKMGRQRHHLSMNEYLASPDTVITAMLQSEDTWSGVARYTQGIPKAKKRDLDRRYDRVAGVP